MMVHSVPAKISLLAILAGLSGPALAQMEFENSTGGTVVIYGQIDPAYLSFDDGVSRTSGLVDNASSNSRVGIWVRQPYGENTFTFNFETAIGFRPSNLMSQNFTPKALSWQRINIRKVDLALNTPRYGRFSAGQGSMASDGVAETDLSGTTLVNYSAVPDIAGGFRFRTTAGALSTRFIGGAFGNFDGGRRGRVRYDSPEFAGFTISASYGEEILAKNVNFNTRDIALRYAGDTGDFTMRGALAYARTKLASGATVNDTIGSFSLLHSSGFNLTLAAGDRSTAGNYAYGKIGYQKKWWQVGETSLAVDYYRGNDRTVAGATSTAIGFGAVQKFDNVGAEAYFGYRSYGLTEPAATYLDAASLIAGARWKF